MRRNGARKGKNQRHLGVNLGKKRDLDYGVCAGRACVCPSLCSALEAAPVAPTHTPLYLYGRTMNYRSCHRPRPGVPDPFLRERRFHLIT